MSAITLLYLPMPKKHTCMLVELKSTENVWSLLYWNAKLLKHVTDSVTCSHTAPHPCLLQTYCTCTCTCIDKLFDKLLKFCLCLVGLYRLTLCGAPVVCRMTWCREGLCVTLHCVVKDFRVCVMTRCRMYGMMRCVYVCHE